MMLKQISQYIVFEDNATVLYHVPKHVDIGDYNDLLEYYKDVDINNKRNDTFISITCYKK